jgi:hypothetical protein
MSVLQSTLDRKLRKHAASVSRFENALRQWNRRSERSVSGRPQKAFTGTDSKHEICSENSALLLPWLRF